MWNLKKTKLIETESRIVVFQELGGWGKWGDIGQTIQTFSYKMNRDLMYSKVIIVNNTVL